MHLQRLWLALPLMAAVALVGCPLNYEGACVIDDNCPTGQSCFEGKCKVSPSGSGGSSGSGTSGGTATAGGDSGGGAAGSTGGGSGSGGAGGSAGGFNTVEGAPGTCADGLDNDSDNQTDCQDSDCVDQICRVAAGLCDAPELCNSSVCPIDEKRGPGTVCRPAVDGGCDAPETCDGTNDSCGPDGGLDVVAPAGSTCRTATAPCDAPEACDGVAPSCPADRFVDAGTLCRMPAGDCDLPDYCDGLTRDCADRLRANTEVCHGSAGDCDPQETCNGTVDCPADVRFDNTVVCRPATDGGCDVEERCNGGVACPADGFRGMGAACRSASGPCDSEEQCSGSSPLCPPDRFLDAGVVCRPDAGVCDLTERCTGQSGACPADTFATSGVCRPQSGACDTAESCNGSAACPADVFTCAGTEWCSPGGCQPKKVTGQTCSAGTECSLGFCFDGRCCDRACGGDCEFCNASGACTFEPSTTLCRPDAGLCDVAERCSGSSSTCPADNLVAGNTPCRPSAGVCDPAEVCSGSSAVCPADVLYGGSQVCRPAGPAPTCDVQEVCDGTSAACPTDRFQPMMTECRGSTGACDPAEVCSGSSASCPSNGFATAGTPCGLAFCLNGTLSPAPQCVGMSTTCQMFSPVSCGGFQCNAAGNACLTSCTDNTQCTSANYCQNPGPSGFCTPKIADGQPCVNAGDCISGVCLTGYVDADNDNYGAGAAARFCTILPMTPTKYVATSGDCCDSNNNVRPNQTAFFSTAIPSPCSGLGFNYDCSTDVFGGATLQHEYKVNGCMGYTCSGQPSHCNYSWNFGCGSSVGWSTSSFPGCGFNGTLRSCNTSVITCVTGEQVCQCGTPTTSTVVDRCK